MNNKLYWYAIISCVFMLFLLMPNPTAEASVFDRIKDIYNTPEKIDELQQQYTDAVSSLEEQKQQLEQSIQQQQELILQNEQYRLQNEQLMLENTKLVNEMELVKQDRDSFIRKLIYTVVIFAIFILAYIVSVRVWRYVVWRKQKPLTEGA